MLIKSLILMDEYWFLTLINVPTFQKHFALAFQLFLMYYLVGVSPKSPVRDETFLASTLRKSFRLELFVASISISIIDTEM